MTCRIIYLSLSLSVFVIFLYTCHVTSVVMIPFSFFPFYPRFLSPSGSSLSSVFNFAVSMSYPSLFYYSFLFPFFSLDSLSSFPPCCPPFCFAEIFFPTSPFFRFSSLRFQCDFTPPPHVRTTGFHSPPHVRTTGFFADAEYDAGSRVLGSA